MPDVSTTDTFDPELTAVLLALAGARQGQRVATVGAGPVVARGLLAGSGTPELVSADADVVVAGAAYEVPGALALLAPGGRLVAVAADAAAARRVAVAAGLELRHVETVGRRVAWSAQAPVGRHP